MRGGGEKAYDSTANGNNGNWQEAGPAGTNGNYSASKIGAWAGAFGGASPYYTRIPTSLNSQSGAMPTTTYSAWVYPTSGAQGDVLADGPYGGRELAAYYQGAFGVVYNQETFWKPVSPQLNQWQYVTVVYTPTNAYFYLNGNSYTLNQTPNNTTGSPGFIMGLGGESAFFQGLMSDIHVSSVARSAGWASTEYSNQNSPSSFYAVSSPTPQSTPDITSLSPIVGDISGGTSVTLTGTGFTGTTAVDFGSTPAASFTVNSSSSVTAVSPAGMAGTVDVTAINSFGTSATSSADHFTYNSWYNSSWQLRQQITIDHTKVGGGTEDENNFPVLISLSGLSNIKTNGADIRFTAADGVTLLPREIESYSNGILTAWVNVPTLSPIANAIIYIYYDNPTATEPAATSTYGSQNVWTNGYAGVWHLNEGSGSTAYDSTANGNNGGWASAQPAGTSGYYSAGRITSWSGAFQGASPYWARIGTNLDADRSAMPTSTWSAWVYPTGGGPIFGQFGAYGSREMGSTGAVTGPGSWWTPGASQVNQWQFVTVVYTTTDVYFYLNGVKYDYGQAPADPAGSGSLQIGNDIGGSFFYGLISDARVSSVARSAGWDSTEYQNQNSPSSFYAASSPMPENIATSIPAVTSLSPPLFGNISGGTSVTITGTGFAGTTAVDFGSTPAESFTLNSSSSITEFLPRECAGTMVDVTAVNSLGTSATSSADHFTYYGTPIITGLSFLSSHTTVGGTSVPITGSGFNGTTAVDFGSTPATSFTVNSDTSITAISPAGSAGVVESPPSILLARVPRIWPMNLSIWLPGGQCRRSWRAVASYSA